MAGKKKKIVMTGRIRIPKMRLPAGIGTKVHKWKTAYTRKQKHRRRGGDE